MPVGTAVDVLTGMDELAAADAAGVFELLCDPTAPMMPKMAARPMRTRQPMPFLLLFKVMPSKLVIDAYVTSERDVGKRDVWRLLFRPGRGEAAGPGSLVTSYG